MATLLKVTTLSLIALIGGFHFTLYADIIIEYQVTPHQDQPLVDKSLILPERIIMSFNEDNVRIQKVGHQPYSSFDLYTFGHRSFYNCVEFMGQKKAFRHDPEYYNITSVSDSTFKVLSIPCSKAIGYMDEKKIEIYYTDIYGANFHPNADIDGIALMYTVEDKVFGKITYLATKIMVDSIPKEMFSKNEYVITKTTELDVGTGKLNKKFPAVSLKNLEGEKFKYVPDTTQFTVINFWFGGCRPCIMEIPYLNTLVKQHNKQPVNFMAISLDKPDQLSKFLNNHSFLYEHFSEGKNAAKKLGIQAYPAHFIIDQHGKIIYESSGYNALSVYDLASKLDSLLLTSND
ncbi:MAG: TlpA family protein disulfide reductase [Reichenbachiella sp.]